MFGTNRLESKVSNITVSSFFFIENHQFLINMTEKTPFSFIVTYKF